MSKALKYLPGFKEYMPEKGKAIFINWATPDEHIIRSGQPYYDEDEGVDTPQKFDKAAIDLLTEQGVVCIVSLNAFEPSATSKKALGSAGIEHLHLPVHDLKSPTLTDLLNGCDAIAHAIAKPGNVLIHCGNGQGRTGTLAMAHTLYSAAPVVPAPSPEPLISDATTETIAQSEALKEFYTHINENDEIRLRRTLWPLYLESQTALAPEALATLRWKLSNVWRHPEMNDALDNLSLRLNHSTYEGYAEGKNIGGFKLYIILKRIVSTDALEENDFLGLCQALAAGNSISEDQRIYRSLLTYGKHHLRYITGTLYDEPNYNPFKDLSFSAFCTLFKIYFD